MYRASLLVPAALNMSMLAFSSGSLFGQSEREFYRVCYEGGSASRVIAACSAVIANQPSDRHELATALTNRANAYDDLHKHELALKDFTEAIGLDQDNPAIFNDRGTTRTALEQYALAIEDFSRALELQPGLAMALSNRCFAKANLGQLDSAMADCNEALRLQQKSAHALASRAFVYLKLRRLDEALRDYSAALALRNNDPYSLFGRAVVKLMKGDLRGSDSDVVRAQALKPDIAEHMARLGVQLRDTKASQ